MKAYASAGESATDDSKLVEDLGIDVKMVLGSYENLKVTTPEDLIIAEEILKRRSLPPSPSPKGRGGIKG